MTLSLTKLELCSTAAQNTKKMYLSQQWTNLWTRPDKQIVGVLMRFRQTDSYNGRRLVSVFSRIDITLIWMGFLGFHFKVAGNVGGGAG